MKSKLPLTPGFSQGKSRAEILATVSTVSHAAQEALFQVQLWHIDRVRHAERFIAIYQRDLEKPGLPRGLKDFARQGIRRHKCERLKHMNFSNAITPFLLP